MKNLTVVFAVLFALSLIGLAATLIYNRAAKDQPVSASVSNNVIAPEEDTGDSSTTANEADSTSDDETDSSLSSTQSGDTKRKSSSTSSADTDSKSVDSPDKDSSEEETTISLYQGHASDNVPFSVGNMFPGDVETKRFCVKVSCPEKATVHYRANIRSGYAKLAEVLKVRVVLLTTGETIYDGLMRDMPKSLSHEVTHDNNELRYEISAYLDTSVGNEYAEKDLVADFDWWVDPADADSLSPSVRTWDSPYTLLLAIAALISLLIVMILRGSRRKEARNGR